MYFLINKARIYGVSPFILHKQRIRSMQTSVEGIEDSDTPEWAVNLLRKRRRSGYVKVRY
jgi:hypothetical protein